MSKYEYAALFAVNANTAARLNDWARQGYRYVGTNFSFLDGVGVSELIMERAVAEQAPTDDPLAEFVLDLWGAGFALPKNFADRLELLAAGLQP